jgi:streptogramin lyase/two-component sensor histidine kinase
MGADSLNLTWLNGLANDKVWTSLCDSQGRMWFGTSGGLSLLENNTFRSFENTDGLSSNKILSLYEDKKGVLWIGTASGVNCIDLSTLAILAETALPQIKVRKIMEDESGNLWFATSKGICKKSQGELKWFELEESDEEESCSSLAQDKHGRIWAGAKNGAYILENENFKRIKLGQNYSSNFVNFLQATSEGMLAGTNNGLYIITGVPGSAWRMVHFGLNDGLGSLETNMNAILAEKDGTMWFGTTAGLMRHTGSFLEDVAQLPAPAIHLTDVQLNLSKTNWKNKADSVDWLSGLPIGLDLPFNQNHFTFLFNAISHRYPEEVKYRYKLDGFDETWQPVTVTPFATYANLPDGDFRFEVQSCGKDGIWSNSAFLELSVSPPFWKTWWFILLASLSVAGIVYMVVKRRRERLFTELEKEKFELKSKLLGLEQQSLNSSMNRHFIFNALNSIQYYINRQDRQSANKYLSSFARLIRKNLDSSQVNHTSLAEELERLELYLQLEHMRFQDKFEYEIEVDENVDAANIRVPSMLLQPFLENSIWHGILPKGEKGKVLLKVMEGEADQVVFTITDDGIGVAASLKNKGDDATHISQGMNITRGRLELIKKMTGKEANLEGPLDVLNDDGSVCGTEVKIKIPLSWTISMS